MRALRPMGFDIDKLDDELVLMALIRALPAEYNSLRQTLLLDDSLTLEKLQDTFVALENQPGASSSLPVLSHAASTVTCTFEAEAQGERGRGVQGRVGDTPGVRWSGDCECWLRLCAAVRLGPRFVALFAGSS